MTIAHQVDSDVGPANPRRYEWGGVNEIPV